MISKENNIITYLAILSVNTMVCVSNLLFMSPIDNSNDIQYIVSRNTSPVELGKFDVGLYSTTDDNVSVSGKSTKIVGSNGIDAVTVRTINTELS